MSTDKIFLVYPCWCKDERELWFRHWELVSLVDVLLSDFSRDLRWKLFSSISNFASPHFAASCEWKSKSSTFFLVFCHFCQKATQIRRKMNRAGSDGRGGNFDNDIELRSEIKLYNPIKKEGFMNDWVPFLVQLNAWCHHHRQRRVVDRNGKSCCDFIFFVFDVVVSMWFIEKVPAVGNS